MRDEVLARLAALVGVALASEGERPLDRLGVDRPQSVVAVLRDHRQEVAEQRALVVGELGRVRSLSRRRWRRRVTAPAPTRVCPSRSGGVPSAFSTCAGAPAA